MSVLRRIEKSLDQRVRAIFAGHDNEPGAREAIELYRDALDQIANRAAPGKRGDRVMPFNLITIELRADEPDRKAVLETLFEPRQLSEDIQTTLKAERVTPPSDLTVAVKFVTESDKELRVICERHAPEKRATTPAQMAPAYIITVIGASIPARLSLGSPQTNLGRVEDLQDSSGRIVRHNEMFFPETGHEANASVSRAHAHISFDADSGDWRIFDDGSSLGTTLFRKGKRIDVPAHGGRGVALRLSDEIYLGQVRLRYESAV
jgi:hypothetical protein